MIKSILRRLCKWFSFLEPYLYKFYRNKAKRSKGEIIVSNWLKENNIKFKQEYLIKFSFIVRKKPFVFIDFYLPKYNTFIEYNGKQHYEFVPYFHKTKDDFERQQFRDFVVRDYCENKGIKLIEIPYTLKIDQIHKLLNDSLLK